MPQVKDGNAIRNNNVEKHQRLSNALNLAIADPNWVEHGCLLPSCLLTFRYLVAAFR